MSRDLAEDLFDWIHVVLGTIEDHALTVVIKATVACAINKQKCSLFELASLFKLSFDFFNDYMHLW